MKSRKVKNQQVQVMLTLVFFTLTLTLVGLLYSNTVSENRIETLEAEVVEQNENLTKLATWLSNEGGILVQTSGESSSSSVLTTLSEDERAEKFLQYFEEAGLTSLITDDVVTIFVPTNEAFIKYETLLADLSDSGNTSSLASILLNHIIIEESSLDSLKTVSGNYLEVKGDSVSSDLESAKILETKDNFVFVDTLLVPAL